MKLLCWYSKVGLIVAAAILCWLGEGPGRAATLSVTPPAVSNMYAGEISLEIGGLTNREQVAIQKYIDGNGNGLVDAGEPLVDAFRIMDGGAVMIGGVTNLNVPFDSNTATGAITTTFSIAPPRSLVNLVGQFVFVLSSPVQNFSPVTATFTITNGEGGQSVSGIVYDNEEAPRPSAVVAILEMVQGEEGGRWKTGVIADSTGNYQVSLEPGSYLLLPTYPGCFADLSSAPVVTLSNGASISRNLFLTNATAAISGKVYNAGNSNSVNGVMVSAEGANYFALGFTDTSGNYTIGVSPGHWQVEVDAMDVITRAFVVPHDGVPVDTTGGSIANVDIGLWKATALLYGRFTNSTGLALTNIQFSANDSAEQYESAAVTDGQGRFCVGVLGGTNEWYCSPDNNAPALAGYVISQISKTNVSAGQALPLNLSVLLATATISGHVQDNLSQPVAGLGMLAFSTIGGVEFVSYVRTGPDGNYLLKVAAGVWNVAPDCCGDNGAEAFGLRDTGMHLVTIPPANAIVNLTLYPYNTPVLVHPERAGTTFALMLSGAPGSRYAIQTCTNLASTNWVTLLVTNLTDNYLPIQDQSTSERRFYRALLEP